MQLTITEGTERLYSQKTIVSINATRREFDKLGIASQDFELCERLLDQLKKSPSKCETGSGDSGFTIQYGEETLFAGQFKRHPLEVFLILNFLVRIGALEAETLQHNFTWDMAAPKSIKEDLADMAQTRLKKVVEATREIAA